MELHPNKLSRRTKQCREPNPHCQKEYTKRRKLRLDLLSLAVRFVTGGDIYHTKIKTVGPIGRPSDLKSRTEMYGFRCQLWVSIPSQHATILQIQAPHRLINRTDHKIIQSEISTVCKVKYIIQSRPRAVRNIGNRGNMKGVEGQEHILRNGHAPQAFPKI